MPPAKSIRRMPRSWRLKAAILFKLKDNDGATRTAQDALAIDPGNAGANVILAAIRFSQGDSDGALKVLANIEKGHADDLGVLFLKINIFNQTGDLAQVESLLRKLIELYPNVHAFRTQLVQFYLTHKRQDDALNELRSVATANPTDTNTELELVSLLAAVKGPEAARAELLARIKAGNRRLPLSDCAGKVRSFARSGGRQHQAAGATHCQYRFDRRHPDCKEYAR